MRGPLIFLVALWLWCSPAAGWARAPVVVELYTAQGCSSCDKADELIARLADRPGVLALTWPVDYWDYLGWKDTFAQPSFAERQRLFDRRLGVRDVYTPQVIVGGAHQAPGADADAVETLIRQARHGRPAAPDIGFLPSGRIAVGSGPRPRGGGEVWLIRFEPRRADVEVKSGENRGRTVVQSNIVRQAVRLGSWYGKPVNLAAPQPSEQGLATAILVQARDGRILAVRLATATKS